MATIDTLLERQTLVRILVATGNEQKLRWIYGLPDFPVWLASELPKLEPGRLKSPDPPQEQVDNIFYRWITGKEIRYSRQFKDLMPMKDEVWEIKTPDIRIFGWMYRPLKFIAVFGDYADLYKGKGASKSYEDAKKRVKAERDKLDLDQPKYTTGTFDELVSV
jgi:hypothetical protein